MFTESGNIRNIPFSQPQTPQDSSLWLSMIRHTCTSTTMAASSVCVPPVKTDALSIAFTLQSQWDVYCPILDSNPSHLAPGFLPVRTPTGMMKPVTQHHTSGPQTPPLVPINFTIPTTGELTTNVQTWQSSHVFQPDSRLHCEGAQRKPKCLNASATLEWKESVKHMNKSTTAIHLRVELYFLVFHSV